MTAAIPDTATVWQTLRTILDPEFAISIVDLGLIYSVECGEGAVNVVMTLTTPTCPSGSWIHEGVEAALRQIPGVQLVHVQLTFEPPWNTAMLSAEARRQLGWSAEEAS
jgi:metal-sulfur cluster biosynthetic enzyme